MGIRWRKRTGGKNGWLNFSYSKKNGFNWSASAKAGPFTWNSGNGKTTRKRITTNLPGGFYHVSTDPRSKRQEPSRPLTPSEAADVSLFAVYCLIVVFSTILFVGPGFWISILLVLGFHYGVMK